MMDLIFLEQFIKKQGWSVFGVADFEPVRKNLNKSEKVFQKWYDSGFGAGMDYLKRMENDRYHPEVRLPDIKSVIVLGANYYWGNNGEKQWGKTMGEIIGSNSSPNCNPYGSPNSGVVARYARGKDYHKILKKKLIELSDWLKIHGQMSMVNSQMSKVETYISSDSGPTVDRTLAESAGLGFFGKNSCIIDPSRGSFFFIASVLTNLDIKPTEVRRMPNCGNCSRCIDSCPTGAIVAPGVIDARKCISYLTIENKGGIPENLRSKIGNRIFGCDICQEVCPFNIGRAHRQQIKINQLKSDFGVGDLLDLRTILSIKSDEEFLKMFAGTPLMRAKRRGLLRNACVVAGNSGDKEFIPYLKEVIKRESDDMIKEHAEWAINQLNG
jgi:epoxyqueuosine reductase